MSTTVDLVERVAETLSLRCNVAIHASPGAGKTWIADAVSDILSAREIDLIRLDLSTRSDGAQILSDLRIQLEGKPSKSIATEPLSTHVAWDNLNLVLKTRTSGVVVILDQFDAVLDYPDGLEFLRLVRELIHRPSRSNCNALFASRMSLDMIEAQVRGISTLASVCYAEYLGAVTREDLESLWPLS